MKYLSKLMPFLFYSFVFLCVHRFSILALEWMLCRFIQSARLMPTSVLEEQGVQDQDSATGNVCQLLAYVVT